LAAALSRTCQLSRTGCYVTINNQCSQTLRLYNTMSRELIMTAKQRAPVLDAAYPDSTTAYCGLLTGEVRRHVASVWQQHAVLGDAEGTSTKALIKCVEIRHLASAQVGRKGAKRAGLATPHPFKHWC
jgi:hypothetical protein